MPDKKKLSPAMQAGQFKGRAALHRKHAENYRQKLIATGDRANSSHPHFVKMQEHTEKADEMDRQLAKLKG